MTKESFLRGAVILAAASMVSRVIGLAYMVVLPRMIYADGMGLYQLVKPIHYFAAVLAIAGMPVAIAKMIAEEVARQSAAGVNKIFRWGFGLMAASGGAVALALIIGAPLLARLFAQGMGVQQTIAILGFSCFLLALGAALRGFFQGLQFMLPTAIAQVAAQILRVLSTVAFCLWLRPRGVEQAVTGIAWGFVVGESTSWLVMLAFYVSYKRELLMELPAQPPAEPKQRMQHKAGVIVTRLLRLSIPAVVVTVLWPVMQLADSLLIPQRMQVAGFSTEAIREGLGHLGMALTLAHFPNIVTVALATSLVPAISEAWALKNRRLVKYRTEEALRMALIFGIPSFAALFVLGEPLGAVLFGYAAVGAPLKILAFGTITLGLIQSCTAVLQGMGDMFIPVRNLFFGVAVKFALNYILLADPALGILGAAFSTAAAWAVVALLDTWAVYRRVGSVLPFKRGVLYPLIAAAAASFSIYFLRDTLVYFIADAAATLISLTAGFLLYFLLLVMWGSLEGRDLHLVPVVGRRLEQFLQAWGFLRS